MLQDTYDEIERYEFLAGQDLMAEREAILKANGLPKLTSLHKTEEEIVQYVNS